MDFPDETADQYLCLPDDCSHLFFSLDHELAAVILIEDPIREEAAEVIRGLKEHGISHVVMMTGDSERTARSIATQVGVDTFYSEVLPEDKASFVQTEREAGRKVIMVGDGINDSPALSAADVGIAIGEGAEIAREVADVTVEGDQLDSLLLLKEISDALMGRIEHNYRFIAGFNGALIALGIAGILPPTSTALLHNGSTIAITMASMRDLLV